MMQRDDLVQSWLAEEAAPFSGWDFSYINRRVSRVTEDEIPWNYPLLVRERCQCASSVLDIGTGGGEFYATLRDVLPKKSVATEGYPPNVLVARKTLEPLGIRVVDYESSEDGNMPFPDGNFDLIIDRHDSFNPCEIERLLTPGGVFLTQQVDGRDLSDLSAVFGTHQPWTHFTLEYALELFRKTKMRIEIHREWQGKITFHDVGAIVYFIRAIPWIVPEGFTVQKYLPQLLALQEKLENEGKLVFTQMRLLIQARKPSA